MGPCPCQIARRPFKWSALRAAPIVFALVLILSQPVFSGVLRVDIDSRQTILNGHQYGQYGAYEVLRGHVTFGFDPANPMNAAIVDLGLAPRNADGLVEARANIVILKPIDNDKSRGIALVEVSNRGGKFSPSYFNRAQGRNLNPANADDFGDGLLMRQGLTVIWVGWQFDVPEREGALRLHVPIAKNQDGSPIFGLVRSDWTIDETARSLKISHRNHLVYTVSDPEHKDNVLTVRNGRDAERRTVPRADWQFAREENGVVTESAEYIHLPAGFEAGKIYELVYRARDPAVVGLGLAAIRDIISYAKYDDASIFSVKHGIAAGVSQTGRFLRHFLYQGFNTDEKQRMAYDGLMIITAGAGRGSFNHRFAQPSRDAHRYSAFFYPTDIFPFTSATQTDPITAKSDGLLAHMHKASHAPKTFYINTGYEYWGRAASLIHTTVDGLKDVEPTENERIYHIASGQHFVDRFPPRQSLSEDHDVYRGNPLEFKVNYRALLVQLISWTASDSVPQPSAYPRIDAQTLVSIEKVKFPTLAGVTFPKIIHEAYRADYGPRWSSGIVDHQPPRLGRTYKTMVSQVDESGNEVAGIRNVEIRVPLASYAPWNLRMGFAGGSHELTDFRGTFVPLPLSAGDDPRQSVAELYRSRDHYLSLVKEASEVLIAQRYLLNEDKSYVLQRAEEYWDWMFRTN